jgi:hypothetical protein
MLSHYLNLPNLPYQHGKSFLKSSSPLPHKAMDYMLSHHFNLPPLLYTAMISLLNHVFFWIFAPSGLQSNGLHAKSLFKSSPRLPYKAMGYMLNHWNLPPCALQSNDQHAKSCLSIFPPDDWDVLGDTSVKKHLSLSNWWGKWSTPDRWKFRSPSSSQWSLEKTCRKPSCYGARSSHACGGTLDATL